MRTQTVELTELELSMLLRLTYEARRDMKVEADFWDALKDLSTMLLAAQTDLYKKEDLK